MKQDLFHYEMGDPNGKAIVFLHGANQSGASWGDIAARLSAARMICVDLPGTAGSRAIPFTGLDDAVDAVVATLCRIFPGQRLPIVGVSLGGYVGFLLGARYPEIIESVVVSGITTRPLVADTWGYGVVSDMLAPLMILGPARRAAARLMRIPQTSSAWPSGEPPCSVATLRRISRAALDFDAQDMLPSYPSTLLALAGHKEARPILQAVDEIWSRVPGSSAALVPAGHAWPAQDPDLFAGVVWHWIKTRRLHEDVLGYDPASHPMTSPA